MAVLNLKSLNKARGMTLIEVLVALAIVAIAMTAIIKAAAQHIRSTSHLQEQSIAYWVANNVMSEARLNLIRLPEKPDKLSKETSMLGEDWYWRAYWEATANKRIRKLIVDVYESKQSSEEGASLLTLTGYEYREEVE